MRLGVLIRLRVTPGKLRLICGQSHVYSSVMNGFFGRAAEPRSTSASPGLARALSSGSIITNGLLAPVTTVISTESESVCGPFEAVTENRYAPRLSTSGGMNTIPFLAEVVLM